MNDSLLKRFWPIALVLIVVLASICFLFWGIEDDADALTVSGTIEVVEMVISVEVTGQVAEMMVANGDIVHAGDALVRFEDEVLQAEYEQAVADLNKVRADYELIAAQLLKEDREVDMANAQFEYLNAKLALKDLMDHANLVRARALQAVDESEQALDDLLVSDVQRLEALEKIAIAERSVDRAEKHLKIISSLPPASAINQAYANMLLAENKVKNTIDDIVFAKQKLKQGPESFWPQNYKVKYNVGFRNLIKNLEVKLSRDQLAYQNAVEKYNDLLKPVDPIELSKAEADLAVAKAQLKQAQRAYARIKDGPRQADIAVLEAQVEFAKRRSQELELGPDPDDLALAQARLQLADANLDLAQVDIVDEQLAVAQLQVDAAETDVRVIQTQLRKLVSTAPVNGTVLSQFIEIGEMVVSGRPAFKIADLDHLTITVYLPENQRHKVQLGDLAVVSPNSFPNQLFKAEVIRIADQGEYTPNNIWIHENERSNVFGVKLVIDNPTGMLKPGMVADVVFQE